MTKSEREDRDSLLCLASPFYPPVRPDLRHEKGNGPRSLGSRPGSKYEQIPEKLPYDVIGNKKPAVTPYTW